MKVIGDRPDVNGVFLTSWRFRRSSILWQRRRNERQKFRRRFWGLKKYFSSFSFLKFNFQGIFLRLIVKKVKIVFSKCPKKVFNLEKNGFLTLFFAGLLWRKKTTYTNFEKRFWEVFNTPISGRIFKLIWWKIKNQQGLEQEWHQNRRFFYSVFRGG
jgi:hypothetical protein